MAQQRPRVVVVGSINMDLVAVTPRFPEDGETVAGTRFLTYPGGKGANQAVAAARLGAEVRFIGRVGNDPFGRQVLDSLRTAGVDVTGVAVDPAHATGVGVISIEEATGQNRIIGVRGANWALDDTDLERGAAALAGADILLLQLEVPLQVSLALARRARERGCRMVLDPAPAMPLPEEAYQAAEVITPNEAEAAALVGYAVADVESGLAAAWELRRRGARAAVVKLGERGAVYAAQEGEGHLPAFLVKAVDTVAAGDAFNGALAVALAEGRSLEEAVRWGTAAGALAVTRHGAQGAMPARAEVEGLLGQR